MAEKRKLPQEGQAAPRKILKSETDESDPDASESESKKFLSPHHQKRSLIMGCTESTPAEVSGIESEAVPDSSAGRLVDVPEVPSSQFSSLDEEEQMKDREISKKVTHQERKYRISRLMEAVQKQDLGYIVVIKHENQTYFDIMNCTLEYYNQWRHWQNLGNGEWTMSINDKLYAKGKYTSEKEAKEKLCEEVFNMLIKQCFYIESKKIYQEIANEEILNIAEGSQKKIETPKAIDEKDVGSKAHQMLLKMGWKEGKGLGAGEQGTTHAVKLVENIDRQGLGTQNILTKINDILRKYAADSSLKTLAFDPEFTNEERGKIHQMARKLKLKSKSVNLFLPNGEKVRKLTVQRKLTRMDLVWALLLAGGDQVESYVLHIPPKFKELWQKF